MCAESLHESISDVPDEDPGSALASWQGASRRKWWALTERRERPGWGSRGKAQDWSGTSLIVVARASGPVIWSTAAEPAPYLAR